MSKYTTDFKVTGVLVNGKRFPAIHTNSAMYAFGINLYRGTVWEWDHDEGKWRKVKEVYN